MNSKNIILLSLLFLFSCSTAPENGGSEAEILHKEILSNYKAKRYLLTLEKISNFRSKYPYSFYIIDVEVLRANIYFEQENFLEAVDAYLSFKDFHPNYKKLDFIEWRISESFFKQLPDTVDRDISPAYSAISSYQALIRKYPDSEYISEAKKRIVDLEKMLENKEAYIADFYFRTKDYQSASYRYMKILKTSRDSDLLKKSANNLVISFIIQKRKKDCLSSIKEFSTFLDQDRSEKFRKQCNKIIEG